MRVILVVTITTGSPTGVAPPARPVPEPRGTNGRPWARHTRTAAWTSSVVSGKHTTSARPEMIDASRAYSSSSRGDTLTRSGAKARSRSATSATSIVRHGTSHPLGSNPMADPNELDHAHEWVSFDDPDEPRTWVFDVTFLLSHWGCIYGRGCQGVLTGAAPELEQGCCSYGAHFTDDDDRRRVVAAAETLTPEQWQFHRQGQQRGVVKRDQKGEQM